MSKNLLKIKPLKNNIWIEPISANSNLVSNNIDRKILQIGKVLGVGEDVKSVAVGDIVAFPFGVWDEVNLKNNKYYFLRDESEYLLAKVEGLAV